MKGIFEDFIGIWDNNVDEKICKELIRYHDWSVKNKYNTSPDTGELIKDNNKDHEAVFMGSASPQYPSELCDHYWRCLKQCIEEYLAEYAIEVYGPLHSWIFKVHKVKENRVIMHGIMKIVHMM